MKIGQITDYELYILRPNCCSSLVDYQDTPNNVHLIEFNSTYQYPQIRTMLTTYNIDKWYSVNPGNCERVLLNETIMNILKELAFNLSIIQTWDLCGTLISDLLNLSRIDYQIESFMYPQLNKMYDFIYYDNDSIVPKSGSDDTFEVFILSPFFNKLRQKYNISIKTQQESWDKMTKFLWIPSIPGYEYPNYLLPRVQFIGAIRSERNKYLKKYNNYQNHQVIEWLNLLPLNAKVLFFSFGTLWHDMDELKHRDNQIFNVLNDILSNDESKYSHFYILFKSIHRDEMEREIVNKFGSLNNRFKYFNYTEWIPQTMILSHKKVKLLICHGGYGHVQEAMYYGVPLIVIPFQFDQPLNSEKTTRIGISYLLNVHNFTSQQLIEGIDTVLNDNSYYKRCKAWSNAMKIYDGSSVIMFTMQAIIDGISDKFKLNIHSENKLKYNPNQNNQQCGGGQ